MTTALIRRPARPRPLLTKELRKRGRLTAWMRYKVYAPLVNLLASLLVLPVLIVASVRTGQSFDAWFGIAVAVDACVLCWSLIWLIAAEGDDDWKTDSFATRRLQVRLDELRKSRAHRDDELSRLRDLDRSYSRYSVLIERKGSDLVMTAVRHERRVTAWPLISWRAEKTKRLYNIERGSWTDGAAGGWRIQQPTVDKVTDALTDAQVTVEEMENESYAEALKVHRLDALVLAMQPPPASAHSRARVAVEEDVLDALGVERE